MNSCLKATLVIATAVWLGATEAHAQGLSGTRPVARSYSGYGYGGPSYYFAQSQAIQAERDAAVAAALERSTEARQAALAEREAARLASASRASAATRAAVEEAEAARAAQVQSAFSLYKSDHARRVAMARHQATMPTDFGAESHLVASAAPVSSLPDGTAEATVDVRVPADAEVWFGGYRTNLTGPTRGFTTPPLEKGKTFAYEIRARWTENGKPVEQTRRVLVQAGANARVDFLSPMP